MNKNPIFHTRCAMDDVIVVHKHVIQGLNLSAISTKQP